MSHPALLLKPLLYKRETELRAHLIGGEREGREEVGGKGPRGEGNGAKAMSASQTFFFF